MALGLLSWLVPAIGVQGGLRCFARLGSAWAEHALNGFVLEQAGWALRGPALCLAFIGASLAAHQRQHLGVESLLASAPPRARHGLVALGSLLSGLITLALVAAFGSAVGANLAERPTGYGVIVGDDNVNVCEATDAQLRGLPDAERPLAYCTGRKLLAAASLPNENPGDAAQLIVPLMLLVIALRLLGQATQAARLYFMTRQDAAS